MGKYRPIRYNSRPLKEAETRYSQIEIESLAVNYDITKNYIYLYGLKEFQVVTDHLPLLPLYNKYKQEMPIRVKHHKTMVQGYNFTLIYEKGGDSFPSDYMSRHPVAPDSEDKRDEEQPWDLDVNTIIQYALPNAISREQMQQACT